MYTHRGPVVLVLLWDYCGVFFPFSNHSVTTHAVTKLPPKEEAGSQEDEARLILLVVHHHTMYGPSIPDQFKEKENTITKS